MSNIERDFAVTCGCGAVRLGVSGDPIVCVYCHCDDCQAVHGGAYLPAALYRSANVVVVSGQPTIWRRRSTARAFCPACGTRLWAEPAAAPIRSVPAHLLPPGVFRPSFHMQCRYAMLPVRDDLPHFRGEPALLGGSDETVDW